MPCSADAERLFDALDNADMDEVNACLDRAPKCADERDDEMRAPLHYAADCANIDTFRRLLDLNMELIDIADNAGFTPLLVAVMAGNVDALKLLIERGAQLTHVDAQKHSAAHWAVVCAQVKSMECLLQSGTPFETVDVYGAYPLHYATVIGDVERAETILHMLLKEGANVNVSDSNGRTPLIWAASNGNEECYQSLIQAGANKFATDHDRLGVLHCAAYHGHTGIIRLFFEQCDQSAQFVNAKDRNGDTPLFYACTYGHYECAKILLDNGADANHTDKRCRCAAHCAAAKGQLRIMKLLRQYGASFQLQNHHGDLPFHEAVQTGSISLVEWLLQVNSKFVSSANFYGRTSLHLSAASGNMELTVLLCNRGTKINPLMLYRGEMYTPLDLARRRNHALIIEYLTQRHEAQSATQISTEKQSTQRNKIKEQLKTAKLHCVRAQLSSSSSEGTDSDGAVEEGGFRAARRRADIQNGGATELVSGFSVFRRNKSMLGRNADSADFFEPPDDAPKFFISRNIKSAPSIRTKSLPKSTSTTDLSMGDGLPQLDTELREDAVNIIDETDPSVNFNKNNDQFDNVADAEKNDGGVEHRLVEATIQKVVNEPIAAQPQPQLLTREFTTTGTMTDVSADDAKIVTNLSTMDTQDSMDNTGKKPRKRVQLVDANELKVDENSRPRLISPPFSSTYYYQENDTVTRRGRSSLVQDEASNEDENGDDEGALTITSQHYQTSRHRIHSAKKRQRRANKSGAVSTTAGRPGQPVQITELHILEEGWHPPIHSHLYEGDTASAAAVERRYVHEKAIFEELTHLKRMQIQYGRVQERVLIRTLIANFCKMHGLNPTHFRYKTFNEWEKFLYDQLKMIYLEERDRILPPSAALLKPGGLLGVGMPPPILPPSQRSRGGANGSHLSILSSLASSRFENRLRKVSPLDERLRELTRIYSNSSISASMARHRRQASSLPRRLPVAVDGAKVPPLFLPKHSGKRALVMLSGAVLRNHNSDAENGGAVSVASERASERAVAGGKRCECLTRQQQKNAP